MRIFSLIILLFLPFIGISQTGPGGVGSNDGTLNLEFWYMAEGEGYSNGDLVGSTLDKSGNGRTLTAVGGERPTYTLSKVGANNRASLSFSLNQELETTYQGNSNENMSFGAIASYINNGSNNIIIQHGGRNTMGARSDHFFADFVGGVDQISSTVATSNWFFHHKTFANTGTNRLQYYLNNTNTDSFTHNIESRVSNTWGGGHGTGGGIGWNGSIAEVYKLANCRRDKQ